MRHYSLLKTIPLSFYSKELYRDVGRSWQGLGFGYMLVAITMFSLPLLLWFLTLSFKVTLDTPYNFNPILVQLPEIHLSHGEVSSAVAQPYYIRDKDTNAIIAILDTNRPVIETAKELQNTKMGVVVGKHEILTIDTKKNEKRLYDVPKDIDKSYTSDDARQLLQKLLDYAWIIPIVVAPFGILMVFLYGMAIMFVYGLCGLIMSALSKTVLSYTDCIRMAAVASTPGLALNMLLLLLHIHYPAWSIFGVDMAFLFYGIRANKS